MTPFRPLHVETPEEVLRRENEGLRAVVEYLKADLRWSDEARHRAVAAWIRAEQRLDAWMPLGVVALAAVAVLALSWITAVLP